jgi:hypothetical protein
MIQGAQTYDGQITVCTAKGRLTFPEIQAKVTDLSSEKLTHRVLCDLTQATVADLTTDDIEALLDLIRPHVSGHGAKAAIIAYSGVDYGVARMFGTFAEISGFPVKVKVFKTSEVAKDWLRDIEMTI